MTIILLIIIVILVLVAVTHYIGFSTREEYLFFPRRGAQFFFFLFLFLLFMFSYLFLHENSMPKTLSEYIVPYKNASPSILYSLSLRNETVKKWTFVTSDSAKDIKEFYLRKNIYNE